MNHILITGGAGFIASNLTGKLLDKGCSVTAVDNYVLGTPDNIADYIDNQNYRIYEEDVTNTDRLIEIIRENSIDQIYHLAANSDIQKGGRNPDIDRKDTFQGTVSVLEAMRVTGVKNLFFASTSAVYGDRVSEMLSETTGGLRPISYYGGAKLASEAFISSYAYMEDFHVVIFRFANVIGPGLTHGVIYDFIRKLQLNPGQLEILGDGTQCKPYIYVADLVEAIMMLTEHINQGVEVYNAGVDSATSVTQIANMVCEKLQLKNVEYAYTGGNRGWKGDVSAFAYDLDKIHQTGWKAKYTSDEAVKKTLDNIC